MPKYIDVDSLQFPNICIFNMKLHGTTVPMVRLVDLQKLIPTTDLVEVVRCGECQYYNDKLKMYSDTVCTIRHYCDGSPIVVGEDDFCSNGKRKDGGQDNV